MGIKESERDPAGVENTMSTQPTEVTNFQRFNFTEEMVDTTTPSGDASWGGPCLHHLLASREVGCLLVLIYSCCRCTGPHDLQVKSGRAVFR